jgi:hypothetical protein
LRPLKICWNVDISNAPVDWRSSAFIDFINADSIKRLHPGFGGDMVPGGDEIWGFPYIVLNGSESRSSVTFEYANQSDGVDHRTGESYPFYPIPDEAIWRLHLIQGGYPGNVDHRWDNDRHMLLVDRMNRQVYELDGVYFNQSLWRWEATSGAFFDLNSNDHRPEGWTSADGSGLAMFPGILRYEEVYGPDEIDHAVRVTLRATNGYVYPASHQAGSTPGALPMGARLRLKANTDLSRFSWDAQKIFRALKKYGVIVVDNGGDMQTSGTYDTRWNNDLLNPAFHQLTASDFEVIELSYHP